MTLSGKTLPDKVTEGSSCCWHLTDSAIQPHPDLFCVVTHEGAPQIPEKPKKDMPVTIINVLADAECSATKRNGVRGVSLSVCAIETESLHFTYLELENPGCTLQDKLLRVTNKF